MNPIAIARYGLLAASNRLAMSSERIVNMQVEGADVDLGDEMVNLMMAKTDFGANAAVIRTADEMQGALLDILA